MNAYKRGLTNAFAKGYDPELEFFNEWLDAPEEEWVDWLTDLKSRPGIQRDIQETVDTWSFSVMLFNLYAKMPQSNPALDDLLQALIQPCVRVRPATALRLYLDFIQTLRIDDPAQLAILEQIDRARVQRSQEPPAKRSRMTLWKK